jgi:hypothetical protein
LKYRSFGTILSVYQKKIMRITLTALLIGSLFTACNSEKKEDIKTDTQMVSPENAYQNSTLTDTAKTKAIAPKTEDKDKVEQKEIVKEKPATQQPATKPTTTAPEKPVYQDNTPTANTGTTTQPSTSSTTPAPATPEVKEKKGMSNTAKGAIIGGVAGAVGGAVISKKKGAGAIIGGVIGAGAGAIIGKQKDKKAQRDTLR